MGCKCPSRLRRVRVDVQTQPCALLPLWCDPNGNSGCYGLLQHEDGKALTTQSHQWHEWHVWSPAGRRRPNTSLACTCSLLRTPPQAEPRTDDAFPFFGRLATPVFCSNTSLCKGHGQQTHYVFGLPPPPFQNWLRSIRSTSIRIICCLHRAARSTSRTNSPRCATFPNQPWAHPAGSLQNQCDVLCDSHLQASEAPRQDRGRLGRGTSPLSRADLGLGVFAYDPASKTCREPLVSHHLGFENKHLKMAAF